MKTHIITIRLDDQEYEKLNQGVKERGIDRTKYIKEKLFSPNVTDTSLYNNCMRLCMGTLTNIYRNIDDISNGNQKEKVNEIKEGIEGLCQYLK